MADDSSMMEGRFDGPDGASVNDLVARKNLKLEDGDYENISVSEVSKIPTKLDRRSVMSAT